MSKLAQSSCVFALTITFAVVTSLWAQQPAGDTYMPGDYATTHIIVKFKPGVMAEQKATQKERNDIGRDMAKTGRSPLSLPAAANVALRHEWETWQVKGMRRGYVSSAGPFARPDLAAVHGLDRTFIVEVPPGTDTWAMAAAFDALEEQVEYAEVDPFGAAAALLPDDPEFFRQYAMNNTGQTNGTDDADIDAPEAWAMHTGDVGTVTVAIVDTGVTPHPDFEAHMVPGINVADPSHPDDTTDACDPTGAPTGHGTHVAGIVAAIGDNADVGCEHHAHSRLCRCVSLRRIRLNNRRRHRVGGR